MFNLFQLSKILAKEPAYRLTQARRAIFHDLIGDWDEASNLPAKLRTLLNRDCPLGLDGQIKIGADGQVQKAALTLSDGLAIETVLIKHKDRRMTVCLSCQAGCPMGCAFCATGAGGFKRNLSAEEIMAQLLFFARRIKPDQVTNVVFMGMGEPMLNFDQVWQAVTLINQEFGLASRHISISTCGVVPGIKKLSTKAEQVNLAISLHAAGESLRTRLMPINKQYSIADTFKAVDNYLLKTNRRVMFEYVMIKNVNDSDSDARQLAKLMAKPLYLVNLVTYNPTGTFAASSPDRIKAFKEILVKSGVAVTHRHSFGNEILAACGQLTDNGIVNFIPAHERGSQNKMNKTKVSKD